MHTFAFLAPWKRFAITGLTILVSLLLYYFFPSDARLDPMFQSIVAGIAFFLVVPILYVRMVLKDPIQFLGFQTSHRRLGWAAVILSVIPALAVLVLLVKTFSVGAHYALPVSATQSFAVFLFYEVFVVGSLIFLYEVFFRGFVMLLWMDGFGFSAALVQALLFAASYAILRGVVTWQDMPLFFTAVISGFVAYYTKSVWYSFAASWLFLFLADAYFLAIR